MNIIFISLVKETGESFPSTVLGKKVSRHDMFGVAFSTSEEAEIHQNEQSPGEGLGTIVVESSLKKY